MKKYEFTLKDLDCAACGNKIEEALSKVDGIENVVVNFGKLKIKYETDKYSKDEVEKMIQEIEPEVTLCELKSEEKKKNEKLKSKTKYQVIRLVLGIILLISGFVLDNIVGNVLVIFAYIILLYRTAKNAIKTFKQSKEVNENLLVTISCVGAYLVGQHMEGAMVIILYEIGKILEDKAINKTRKSIADLMDIKPEYANLKHDNSEHEKSCIHDFEEEHEHNHIHSHEEEHDHCECHSEEHEHHHEHAEHCGCHSHNDCECVEKPDLFDVDGYHEHKVSPEKVKIGDIIIVKPGEKVPLDGEVVKGTASLNTASLTGESKLRKVTVGDKVLSGSINTDGLLELEVTEEYENSTVNKILELVENATDKKAKTETMVNTFAKVYTPIVMILAVIVAVLLPFISTLTFSESIYRALIFLVISCPCAIAISVPLSYFSGIGRASKEGILIKGSDYLDLLKKVNQIAFDKTGTLTKGEFSVSKIEKYSSYSEKEILKLAAMGESFSNHPIAKSILKEIDYIIPKHEVVDYREITGKGLEYKHQGNVVLVGNKELVNFESDDEENCTKIYVKLADEVIGAICLTDTIKLGVKEALKELKENGIATKMFTGDNLEVAKLVGEELGLDEIKAEMLPNEKYSELEKMIENNKNGKVAFVGDGINDSPVLARADVGISMGGVGAGSAIEASDIVIMTDDITKINEGIQISKFTGKIIKQNLIFAIATKVIILALSVIGIAGMWQAIFADVGVTLITILNTLRILKVQVFEDKK